MKKYIYKINQYLLENYPTIWNTKIVWMLGVSFIIHLIFFILGYVTLTNPEMLHERGAKDIFFKNGVVFFSIIISILLLVIWLIYLFKNNAFKNFYPTSKLKLFSQFISYLVIIFCATTFYISYNFGIVSYISNTYKDDVVSKEIKQINNAAVFFSEDVDRYTVPNIYYPTPFYDLYCEKISRNIDYAKSHLSWLNTDYQFYSLSKKERKIDDKIIDNLYANYVYSIRNDSIETYFYKDTIVDVSNYLATAKPRYYNFSNTFYISDNDVSLNYSSNYTKYYNDGNSLNLKRRENRNKYVYELLNRNNPNEIKTVLNNAVAIINKYKISHNITADEWFKLIYNPDSFEVQSLIRNEEKDKYSFIRSTQQEKRLEVKFTKEHITDYYIESSNLKRVFENIEDVKSENYFTDSIHVFIWLSFIFSIIIFLFRITGLKPLLFTIVTLGLLIVLISLFTALFGFILDARGNKIEYFILYLMLIIGAVIFTIPLFFTNKVKKIIVAISLNISMLIFPFYILLIIGIISMYQRANCKELFGYSYDEDCFILIEEIGFNLSFILFVVGIIFIYFYSTIIKKWKALPEG